MKVFRYVAAVFGTALFLLGATQFLQELARKVYYDGGMVVTDHSSNPSPIGITLCVPYMALACSLTGTALISWAILPLFQRRGDTDR